MLSCLWACICNPKAIVKDKSHIFLFMNTAMFKFKCKGTTIISFLQSLFVMIFGFCDLRPKVKGFLWSKAPKYVQQFPRWDKCPTSLSYNHTKTTGIMIDYYNDKTLTCRPSTRIAPSCFSSFRHRCNEYFWIPKWSASSCREKGRRTSFDC